jgi:hypothetical protein
MPDFDHVQAIDVGVNGPRDVSRLTIVTGVAIIALQGTIPDKWRRNDESFAVPGPDGNPLTVGNGFRGATVSVFPATGVNTTNQQLGWGVDSATVARDADHNQLIVTARTVVFGNTARLLRIGFQVHILTAPTSSNTITEYSIPTANSHPYYGITSGTDGNLWFTEINGNQIGRIICQ